MKKLLWAALAALLGALILNAQAADAADLATKAPVYKAPPIAGYDWTGFYLGVNAGLGVSQTRATFPALPSDVVERGGSVFTGGGQAGFNWQFAPQWVAGIEGDIGSLNIDRSFRDLSGPSTEYGADTHGYGTIRGRLGYTSGPSLFYATGGAAFVRVTNNFDRIPLVVSSSESKTASGWTVGGGIETMLGGNWSAKAEYLYIDAGSQDVFSSVFNTVSHTDNRFHIYRYGLNYKFGGPAATAPSPTHDWTGFYAGVNAGTGLSQDHVSGDPLLVGAADITDLGFAGGMQAGYNWQVSPIWVAGVEGDIGGLGISRTLTDFALTVGVKTDWYGTLRGRLGYSTGPALLYATGGAALVNVRNDFDTNLHPVSASRSKTATGWTVGGGIETVLVQNWTVKTEYLFIDAGKQDVTNPAFSLLQPVHFDNRFHVFRFGLNYAFGGL